MNSQYLLYMLHTFKHAIKRQEDRVVGKRSTTLPQQAFIRETATLVISCENILHLGNNEEVYIANNFTAEIEEGNRSCWLIVADDYSCDEQRSDQRVNCQSCVATR